MTAITLRDDFRIIKGIELPPVIEHERCSYPLKHMKVAECFDVPASVGVHAVQAAAAHGYKYQKTFDYRVIDAGTFRIWRRS
jgi:hypothetical protein